MAILACVFLFFGVQPVYGDPAGGGIQGECGTSNSAASSGKAPSRGKRQGGRSQGPRIPGPERNRLAEGASSKKPAGGKRKKGGKGSVKRKKKRRTSLLSSENAANPLKNTEPSKGMKISTERVDDVPLLIGIMMKIGLQEIIDNHIRRHHLQRKLSWGWTAVIWLAYILSEGDHRKVAVRDYIKGMATTLRELTGQPVDELDFMDDRLGNLLRYFSIFEHWHEIEREFGSETIAAYDLPEDDVRVDATTVSGWHEVFEKGLFQFGHSKDDPNLPQIKMMVGALDPLGMPLATDVVSGEKPDDNLYIPVIKRIAETIKKAGVLYTGDCKLSSLGNRLQIVDQKDHYLCPLSQTGKTAGKIDEWIMIGVMKDKKKELEEVKGKDKKGKEILISKGYEFERELSDTVGDKKIKWIERVIISKSPAHADRMEKGLEKRIKNATEKINKLTPQRGRGKRQITEESQLKEAAGKILKRYKVGDFLTYEYEREVETKTKYVGRGRGGAKRKQVTEERVRYQITKVVRLKEKIKLEKEKFGWKAFVTDVPKNRLSYQEVIKHYRKEYRVERIFNRLKSRLNISPLYVKKENQIAGKVHLLSLGVRIYTLVEFLVRRSLRNDNEKLGGLHPENKRKKTDTPTAERLLKAFSKIDLTIIESGDRTMRSISPLTPLQKNILKRLELSPSIYEGLEISKSNFRLSEW
jgi:transposase